MELALQVALIAAIASAIVGPIVTALLNRAKRHNEHDENEADEIRKWRNHVDKCLKTDKEQIDSMNAGINTLCKLNLAMASHMLDGNNTEQLKDARDNLHNYLIER